MEQFPLEDDNIPTVKTEEAKSEDLKTPLAELPHLAVSDINFEEKKPVILHASKPMPEPDPIILKPQNAKFTSEDILKTTADNKIIIKKTMPMPLQYTDKGEDFDEKRRETFFSKLKEQLEKQGREKISIDPKRIMQNMKDYQQNIMVKEKALKEKQSLDSELADKIMTLELLEDGWYMLRKEIETKQILLLQKEKLIDTYVLELKLLMEKEKGIDKRMIPVDKWFILKDGRKISSIEELKETLKTVEPPVFYHHVNETKNDFSSWIRHVFEDASLADRIIDAKTREELLNLLENH